MANDTLNPAIALAFRSSLLTGAKRILEFNPKLTLSPTGLPAVDTGRAEIGSLLFFGGSSRRLSATLGGIHPQLPKGEIHRSTADGLNSLIQCLELGKQKPVAHLAAEHLEGSAAILGGPVANLHARLIMGCGGNSPLFDRILPVTFSCPAGQYAQEPWSVVVDGRSSRNECLVITSIPMGAGRDRLTIFAGLHGAGTRAIDFVLRDQALLEKLHAETRRFTAWQALIEVSAIDFERPKSLGHYRVFEISNVDFENQNNVVRDKLLLDAARIEDLLRLLPPQHRVNRRDPVAIGMRNVEYLDDHRKQKLARQQRRVSVASVPLNSRSTPGWPLGHPENRAPGLPPSDQENPVNISTDQGARPRWGRPPKNKSGAKLVRRLQILLSHEESAMIEDLKRVIGTDSIGEVIRSAVRSDYERSVARKKEKNSD